ncbi:MAG: family 78 glycoside hydrolase catalytic domain [Clostridia bacterium]|nr:family 78 glycoside hydrolase catalytic domain [Clostridia bacterium]
MKWITDSAFAGLEPVDVFHRERQKTGVTNDEERMNSHILFRRAFTLDGAPEKAEVTVSADDRYKLYINGEFAGEGPAPAYHDCCGFDVIDVTRFLRKGRNVIAAHTYYQGLINRVWQSGDRRHGFLFSLRAGEVVLVESDGSFLTHRHTGYGQTGRTGYDTQFLERYDSRAPEVGFEQPDFDDSAWEHATVNETDDHAPGACRNVQLCFENITPARVSYKENGCFVDLGGAYVGYLTVTAKGEAGQTVRIRCGHELNEDGSVRYKMRANCAYDEEWILSGKTDELRWFDYKSFRYAEILTEPGMRILHVGFVARHQPFTLTANISGRYAGDADVKKVWDLCVRSQRYGVQELPMDCMEREKGTYLGDGCYTSLTNYVLTCDPSVLKSFVRGAFATARVTETLLSCLYCSHMQEIAEYPLLLPELVLRYLRLSGDAAFAEECDAGLTAVLEGYRKYEKDGILGDTGQWCVTEWPANYRDGYAVVNDGNKPLPEPHVAINAYYNNAIRALNRIRISLGKPAYRDEKPLCDAFNAGFYDSEKHLYRDGLTADHISYIGNAFPFGFGLCPDPEFNEKMLSMFGERGVTGTSLFATVPLLCGLVRLGRYDLVKSAITDRGAWLNMIAEGATSTFENFSRDGKWNTSLFHLQNTHIAIFIADIDHNAIPV